MANGKTLVALVSTMFLGQGNQSGSWGQFQPMRVRDDFGVI